MTALAYNPPDPTNSFITVSPSTLGATGFDYSSVTVHLVDAFGNTTTLSGGHSVTISTTLGQFDNTFTSSKTCASTGDTTCNGYLYSSASGTATITATYDGILLATSSSVAFENPSAATSTISASPTTIIADGLSQTAITVRLKDAGGVDLQASGQQNNIALSTTNGSFGPWTDNGDGSYTRILTSSVVAGTATITGTLSGQPMASSASVQMVPGPASGSPGTSTIAASPASIPANAVSASTVTVRLADANANQLQRGGDSVVLSTDAGVLSGVTDNGDGTYTATLTSATSAGIATITGTVNGQPINSQAQVSFTPVTADAANTTITAAPSSVTAGANSTITVQAKDSSGVNLSTGGDTVSLTATQGALGPVTYIGNGRYTATLRTFGFNSGTTSTITGQINGQVIGHPASVTITAVSVGPADPNRATISSSRSVLIADGVSTAAITVKLYDSSMQALTTGGDSVTLSTTAGTLSSVTDLGNGSYRATLTAPISSASDALITGRVNGTPMTATKTVRMFAGPADPSTSTIVASPSPVTANGIDTSVVTVTLKDAHDNPEQFGGDTVSLTTDAGTLDAVTDNGNGTYTATLTSATSAALATISGTVGGQAMSSQAQVTFVAAPAPPSSGGSTPPPPPPSDPSTPPVLSPPTDPGTTTDPIPPAADLQWHPVEDQGSSFTLSVVPEDGASSIRFEVSREGKRRCCDASTWVPIGTVPATTPVLNWRPTCIPQGSYFVRATSLDEEQNVLHVAVYQSPVRVFFAQVRSARPVVIGTVQTVRAGGGTALRLDASHSLAIGKGAHVACFEWSINGRLAATTAKASVQVGSGTPYGRARYVSLHVMTNGPDGVRSVRFQLSRKARRLLLVDLPASLARPGGEAALIHQLQTHLAPFDFGNAIATIAEMRWALAKLHADAHVVLSTVSVSNQVAIIAFTGRRTMPHGLLSDLFVYVSKKPLLPPHRWQVVLYRR
jgi:Invasin, domain 3